MARLFAGAKRPVPPLICLEQIRHGPVEALAARHPQLSQQKDLPDSGPIPWTVTDAGVHPVALWVLGKKDISCRAGFGDSSAADPNLWRFFVPPKDLGQRQVAR